MDQRIDELLEKYIKGKATLQEQQILQAWYESKTESEVLWPASVEGEESLLRDKLFSNISGRISSPKVKQKKLGYRVLAAAIILVIVSVGVYLFNYESTGQNNKLTYSKPIIPGKNGATLTLANGQQILINEALAGNIAKQSGVKISKSKSGQLIYQIIDDGSPAIGYNTLRTVRGEQIQVQLADGSIVFLNAASSLKYPTSFKGATKRAVSLTGEGYFEITKDKAHPFVVQTAEQQVEVLGTHFNINSYSDEPMAKTTLLEGSVRIKTNSSQRIIKPGDQALLLNNQIKVQDADIEEVMAWKNGLFLFNDEPLESIMRKISRWYDVDVQYGDIDKTQAFGGGVSRFSDVYKVLQKLESTKMVHFKVQGRTIFVSK